MNRIGLFFSYLRYFARAKDEHGIHSPFVFELYTEVIKQDARYYAFNAIESIRAKLLLNNKKIEVRDLGAGSVFGNKKQKAISHIARNAAKSKKYGELLFRLVNYFQPKHSLELGTSLGISSLYIAMAKRDNQLITIEGCPATASVARENFRLLHLPNVSVQVGSFEEKLPEALQKNNFDFIFFDGNHRKEPTLTYFRKCLERSGEHSVFVFDDIHWSPDMEAAWEEIKNDRRVTVTIDLFFIGIVFFRSTQVKEHFVLRF
jgi:predicted O-methyltransferase YrrM